MNKYEKTVYKKVNKLKRPYNNEELLKLYLQSEDRHSARYRTFIGDTRKIAVGKRFFIFKKYTIMELKDKLIYPIDICPYCSSEDTFHKRHLEKGIAGTCWDTREIWDERGMVTLLKFDYCLYCQRKFLIESYAWKDINL